MSVENNMVLAAVVAAADAVPIDGSPLKMVAMNEALEGDLSAVTPSCWEMVKGLLTNKSYRG